MCLRHILCREHHVLCFVYVFENRLEFLERRGSRSPRARC